MISNIMKLAFENCQIAAVVHNGEPLLDATDVARALQFHRPEMVASSVAAKTNIDGFGFINLGEAKDLAAKRGGDQRKFSAWLESIVSKADLPKVERPLEQQLSGWTGRAGIEASPSSEGRTGSTSKQKQPDHQNLRGVTILGAKGIGSKKFSRGVDNEIKVESYSKAREFEGRVIEVADFTALASLMTAMLDRTDECIVLGSIRPGVDTTRMLRRSNGRGATLDDTPGQIMHIDIDGLLCPAALDMTRDPARAMEYAREQLVDVAPELKGVRVFTALSSSAGIKSIEKIYAHFWFLLETPLTTKQVKSWARKVNEVAAVKYAGTFLGSNFIDLSIYSAAHIHYTARPRFGVGICDPFEGSRRWSVLEGSRDRAPIVPPAPSVRRTTKASLRLQRVYAPRAQSAVLREQVAAALKSIPNNNFEWEDYKRVAMATHAAIGENLEAGRQLFHGWAEKSDKYDALETDATWHEVCNSPATEITERTLWWLASWGTTKAAIEAKELPTDESWKFSKTRLPASYPPAPARAPADEIQNEVDAQVRQVFAEARASKLQKVINDKMDEIYKIERKIADSEQHFPNADAIENALRRKERLENEVDYAEERGEAVGRRGNPLGLPFFASTRLLTADCGTGKSRAVVRAAADNPDIFVDHVVPDMDLAHALLKEYEECIGERVVLHLGMNQPDPDYTGQNMCRRGEESRAYMSAGGRAQDLCGNKTVGICPMAGVCGYMRQMKSDRYRDAQVIVSAGTSFMEKHQRGSNGEGEEAVARRKDLLVVDDLPVVQLFRQDDAETVTWADFADPMMKNPLGKLTTEGE